MSAERHRDPGMERLPVRWIVLDADEQDTLVALAEQARDTAAGRLRGARSAVRLREAVAAADAVARVFEAAEAGAVDVRDPVLRGWLAARRDALLAHDAGDL